jgi:hypothetical protein
LVVLPAQVVHGEAGHVEDQEDFQREVRPAGRGNQVGPPALAGELGATYAIPIIYVPVLMITHVVAFYLLMRPQPRVAVAGNATAY